MRLKSLDSGYVFSRCFITSTDFISFYFDLQYRLWCRLWIRLWIINKLVDDVDVDVDDGWLLVVGWLVGRLVGW
jgi:hypothetical protein